MLFLGGEKLLRRRAAKDARNLERGTGGDTLLMPLDHGFERTFVTALRGLDIMSSAQKASPVQGALVGRVACDAAARGAEGCPATARGTVVIPTSDSGCNPLASLRDDGAGRQGRG